nr:uncharacterized protein LOC112026652 [Quercus suber]
MAVVIGNLALLLDVISPRTVILDRRTRPVSLDFVLNLPKRDPHHHQAYYASIASKSFDSDGEARHQRVVARGKSNSKVNGVDFDASSSDEEGNGNGEGDEESFDWEKEMRRRVKEIEERRELEKKAEELQSRMEEEGSEGGDEGKEETEEEKRARVRKELEKVAKEQAERRATAQLMFELGQKAYGKGMYGRAIEFLEGALTIIPRPTLLGGEVGLNNLIPTTDLFFFFFFYGLIVRICSSVFTLLVLEKWIIYAGTWTDKYKDKDERRIGSTTNQLPSSRDYLGDFLVWRPPIGLEKNGAFWAALTLWLGLVGAVIFLQR